MDQATHSKIVSFIWGIADDVLRDLFNPGKYPDVILPMRDLRRLDAVLEPTKQAVLNTVQMLDAAEISFTRYFYQPKPMRSLEEIRADILAIQKESEGLVDQVVGQASRPVQQGAK